MRRAAQYWANKATQTGNPIYHIPGTLAAAWTPCTSSATSSVLLGGGTFGSLIVDRLGTASTLGFVSLVGSLSEAGFDPTSENIASAMTSMVGAGVTKSILNAGKTAVERAAAAVVELSSSFATSANE